MDADRPACGEGIVLALPQGRHYPEGGESILRRMVGARILAIGSPEAGDIDGGGFVIDFQRFEGATAHRLVLGLSDQRMWVVRVEDLSTPA